MSDLGGLLDGSGASEDDGGDGGGCDGEVVALDPEAVDGVGDVVDGPEDAVGVNLLVGTGGHAVCVAGLKMGCNGKRYKKVLNLFVVALFGYINTKYKFC